MGNSIPGYQDFVKILAKGATGYMGLTKVYRSQNPESNNTWGKYEHYYPRVTSGKVDLPEESLEESPGWEWHIIPAILSSPRRMQTEFKMSNVIWVDVDTPGSWEDITPAPSVVVETSRGKFHLYWILEKPITQVSDMRYWCRRLLDHCKGDPTGFDATQSLRLPYGYNLKLGARNKDGSPFSPKVVKLNPRLKYKLEDFDDLPEPPLSSFGVVDISNIDDAPDRVGTWEESFDKYEEDLPPTMYKKLARVQDTGVEKRSGGLYSLTCDLLKYLNDPRKVYEILWESPNDKFTEDNGPSRGAVLLWKDINRIHGKLTENAAAVGVRDEIYEIMDAKIPTRTKGVEVARLVLRELSEKGKFIRTTDGGCLYYDRAEKVPALYAIDVQKTAEFTGFISRKYDINPGVDSAILSGIMHGALHECQVQEPTQLHKFAYYDMYTNKVYIDRNDSTMYVLDGESIQHEIHGYDDVYFHRTTSSYPMPFTYTPDYNPGDFTKMVLEGPNYSIQDREVEQVHLLHIVKTWLTCLFFPSRMETKPLLFIHGDPDSGKTTLFRIISLLLTGDSTYSVTSMPENPQEFNVLVANTPFVFLDNVNTYATEMQERLAQVATGYAAKTRTLYTTADVTTLRSTASVGLTSFTTERLQRDVTERCLILTVHPYTEDPGYRRKSLSNIFKQVSSSRDALWSELLDYVNKVVKTIGKHGLSTDNTRLRMSDFAAFLSLTADMDGLDYRVMEDFLFQQHAEVYKENDPLYVGLGSFLQYNQGGMSEFLTAKDIHSALASISRKFRVKYPKAARFEAVLNSASPDLELVGIFCEKKVRNGTCMYKIQEHPKAREIPEDNWDPEVDEYKIEPNDGQMME